MEKEVIGFIDWEGVFHPCSYGEHSLLAVKLAKKLLKKNDSNSTKKITYGLVQISRSCFDRNSDMYYCYLPKGLNQKQKEQLKNIMLNTNLKQLSAAISEAFNKMEKYPEKFEKKIDVLSLKSVSGMTNEDDYGILGSSIRYKYNKL
jgi:hypothetical protein